jgi:hypothetical protein
MNRNGVVHQYSRAGLGALLSGTTLLFTTAAAADGDNGATTAPSPASSAQVPVTSTYQAGSQPAAEANRTASFSAPPPSENILSRMSGGVRLNYGLPSGDLAKGQSLKSLASGLYRVEGDVDFLVAPRLAVGLHAGVGIATLGDQVSTGCNAGGGSCSSVDFDLGAHAEYMFLPTSAPVSPWVGLGASFEALSLSDTNGSNTGSFTARGVDLDLSAGVDVNLKHLSIGPFVTYRVGRYTSVDEKVNDVEVNSADIGQTDWHEWLMLGIRGRYWLAQ